MNNVVDTARQEGVKKGLEEGRLAERSLILNRQRSLILRLLSRTVGELTNDLTTQINQLPIEKLEALNEILLDFKGLDDLIDWLKANISTF
jgi:predicted transposase YdaD